MESECLAVGDAASRRIVDRVTFVRSNPLTPSHSIARGKIVAMTLQCDVFCQEQVEQQI